MKMTLAITAALAAFALAPAAVARDGDSGWTSVRHNNQPTVVGSGRIVRQSRPISAVEAIELTGAGHADIRLGAAPSLTIEADDNVMLLLTSDIRRGTLVLDAKGSYRTRHAPRYTITLPSLSSLSTQGSGDAIVEGVAADRFGVAVQGSGSVRATGRARNLAATVSGSGSLDLANLTAIDAAATVNGSGQIRLAASGRVVAASNGSGDIQMVTRPASLQQARNGSGTIRVVTR